MSNTLQVLIDHMLRVDMDALPEGAFENITDALSIPNLAREQARKMDQWGWQRMPATIPLYKIDYHGDDDGGTASLLMPRGFLGDLAEGMNAYGYSIELIEGRNRQHHTPIGDPINLRPWQERQVAALEAWEQGILKAPAGSGKTVAILAAIQSFAAKSIVIVNTKDILWQWVKRSQTFLPDYPEPGQIGGGLFEVSEFITISTAQTLHSRFDDLEAEGFFDQFAFVCLDECHHATAETYNKILNRFSARYRVGVSATPDKTGDFALATNVLGPIIHEVDPDEVDTLMKPMVVRVPTKFGFSFRGHKNRYVRSNYPQMIDALIRDPGRNQQIIGNVFDRVKHHQLLVSKRLEHLDILEDLLLDHGFTDPIYRLTGKDSNEDREHVVLMMADSPGLLLSTLADEALDIPRLDTIHLAFPQKNSGLVTQQVGRVEREHPDKADAIIFDYADGNVGPLEKQWRTRRFEVYEPRGYKIIVQKR